MRSIDIHAHLTPQCFLHAMAAGKLWHGIKPGTVRVNPRGTRNPEQRIADMNPWAWMYSGLHSRWVLLLR
jgi:hypothetical protein